MCTLFFKIFCSRSISGASLGQLGDTMTVEVIESQQGSMCWRAITVASAATAPSTQVGVSHMMYCASFIYHTMLVYN